MPFAAVAINRNLFVTPAERSLIDPWMYTGAFLSLPDYLHRFHDTYYLSRLSWLLPGFVAHRMFPPLVANAILHFTFFYGLLVATYALVAVALNRSLAMLVTIVVGWSPVILTSFSWDLVDGPGIVFLVVTLACLERASRLDDRAPWWATAAGGSFACMVSVNLFLLVYGPLFVLFLMVRVGRAEWRRALRMLTTVAGGSAAVVVLLGLTNRWLGGEWFFFMPSIHFAQQTLGEPNPWKEPGGGWILRSIWLVLPAFASVGALLMLHSWRELDPFRRALQVTLLAALGLWCALQAGRLNVLQIPYYTSYLAILALVALPLQARADHAPVSARRVIFLELGTFTFFALAHWVIVAGHTTFWPAIRDRIARTTTVLLLNAPDNTGPAGTIVAACVGLTAVLALRSRLPFAARWMVFVVGLMIASPAVWPYKLSPFWPRAAAFDAHSEFAEVVSAHRFIDEHIAGRSVRFWYEWSETGSTPLRAISSTYLWGYALLNERMPDLTADELAVLKPDTRLVLLIERAEEADMARESLRRCGLEMSVVAERRFAAPTGFSVLITDLRGVRSPRMRSCAEIAGV